jgi:hypothetical protein
LMPTMMGGCAAAPPPEPTPTPTPTATPTPPPPVANAGPDQNVTGGDTVKLDGSGSTSSAGKPLTFAWTQTQGTAIAGARLGSVITLPGFNTATPSFTAPDVTDVLTFQLVVNDGTNSSLPSLVNIHVTAKPVLPPVANAGPNQSVTGATTVILDGSGSTDPQGKPLTFVWTQTAGTTANLMGANTAKPTFVAPNTTQTLTFQLIVNNGVLNSAPALVNVNVTATGTHMPPVANAGPDQSVNNGDNVTLDGSASTDPQGTTLTFAWTQTGGTAVTLTGANTAKANFIAPNANDNLTFQLKVTDAEGETATDSVTVTVKVIPPVLFVVNRSSGNKILSFTGPAGLTGNVPPATNISGTQTLLTDPVFGLVNSTGAFMVANVTAVTIYDNATTANGNLAPSRNILGGQTQLTDTWGVAFDKAKNLLYVANSAGGPNIVVFANATTVNGNTAPIRTITSTGNLNAPRGLFLVNDSLYVANSGAKNVLVFDAVSTLNGNNGPSRTVTSAAFTGAVNDVFVDKNNILFVINPANQVLVFNGASGLNGPKNPDVTLTVSGATLVQGVAVDSNGTGFITDVTANAIYSYDKIATRNGTILPDRTITGANTQLNRPNGLFLLEK